jgi:hypothetical protein
MAVAEDEQTEKQTHENGNGSSGHGALKAAAAAAATGAATFAVQKAISSHGRRRDTGDEGDDAGMERRTRAGSSSSVFASAGSSAWEAASGALVPLAEEAAEAAGKYLAEHAPDVVRDRIVPRFIKAFNEAD